MKHFCIVGLALFALLSVGDFALTYLLVEGSGGSVYEANPVAAEWLVGNGWVGLALFKAAAVIIVIGTVLLIVRRRPAVGAAVACLACLATGSVNVHSHRLLSANGADVAAAAREGTIDEAITEMNRFHRVMFTPVDDSALRGDDDSPRVLPPAIDEEKSRPFVPVRGMPRD